MVEAEKTLGIAKLLSPQDTGVLEEEERLEEEKRLVEEKKSQADLIKTPKTFFDNTAPTPNQDLFNELGLQFH